MDEMKRNLHDDTIKIMRNINNADIQRMLDIQYNFLIRGITNIKKIETEQEIKFIVTFEGGEENITTFSIFNDTLMHKEKLQK